MENRYCGLVDKSIPLLERHEHSFVSPYLPTVPSSPPTLLSLLCLSPFFLSHFLAIPSQLPWSHLSSCNTTPHDGIPVRINKSNKCFRYQLPCRLSKSIPAFAMARFGYIFISLHPSYRKTTSRFQFSALSLTFNNSSVWKNYPGSHKSPSWKERHETMSNVSRGLMAGLATNTWVLFKLVWWSWRGPDGECWLMDGRECCFSLALNSTHTWVHSTRP